MLLSLERGIHVGAFVFFLAGAVRQPRFGERPVVRPGSKNMCKWILGFPRNLGGPVVSTVEMSGWRYRMTNSRSVAWHAVAMEVTKSTACSRGIVERRKRSEAI